LNTGITNVDRYLAFTNHAVLPQSGQADSVTSNVVNRFIPANASETLTYDVDGNFLAYKSP